MVKIQKDVQPHKFRKKFKIKMKHHYLSTGQKSLLMHSIDKGNRKRYFLTLNKLIGTYFFGGQLNTIIVIKTTVNSLHLSVSYVGQAMGSVFQIF